MSSEPLKNAACFPGLVREFEHWTLVVAELRPEGTLILLDRVGARTISALSDESLREMLAIVRLAESALVKVRGSDQSDQVDCRWVTPPRQRIQVHLVPGNGDAKTGGAEQLEPEELAALVGRLRQEIPVRCEPWRRCGRVYTTGCFDLFHVGHLNIIRASRAIADELVVGVSTDELIESEKGARPSVSLEDRMAIVAAIRHVDEVIGQTDKNKQRIVEEYAIDAITVGGDWKGRYPSVTCELVYFPYTKHTSSSRLKDEIANLVRV